MPENSQPTKRATKKALEDFCINNSIDAERIFRVLETVYPNQYQRADNIPSVIIKAAFKAFDGPVGDREIAEIIEAEKNHIYQWSFEGIANQEKQRIRTEKDAPLREAIHKLCIDAEKEEFALSQLTYFPHTLVEYMKERYLEEHPDTKCYSNAKEFYWLCSIWEYDNQRTPFWIYDIPDGDVLFTHSKKDQERINEIYNENSRGCLGTLLMMIATGLLSALAIAYC